MSVSTAEHLKNTNDEILFKTFYVILRLKVSNEEVASICLIAFRIEMTISI